MLTITENAARQIRTLVTDNEPEKGLRIFIVKGGCSGLQYEMKIDAPEPSDEVVDCGQGARVFIDTESLSYIRNSQIDYVNTLTSNGFKIVNPNAKQTCGCGTSFGV